MRNVVAAGLVASCSLLMIAVSGCSGAPDPQPNESTQSESAALGGLHGHDAEEGRELFFHETFRGNGRTCGTCHTRETGTISPEQIRHLARTDPDNPIFRSIDSDDGVGHSYTRLMKNATIRITLDLPPNIRLHDNPTAKTFTVNRSTPTFLNASLNPVQMWDGRNPDLQSQALGAVHAHDQNRIEPTAHQLDLLAAFEDTQFTNPQIARYARGGPPPVLPDGRTASEKRGRVFFEPDKACGMCHDGPMLNRGNQFNPLSPDPVFNTVFAGWEGGMGFPQPPDAPNPPVLWDIDCPTDDGGFFCGGACQFLGGGTVTDNVCTMPMPDPGEMIPTANPDLFLFFKTPTLWGVKDTAPYFHDNSALTLEDLMVHYDKFFRFLNEVGFLSTQNGFTAQEQTDIINYLKLL